MLVLAGVPELAGVPDLALLPLSDTVPGLGAPPLQDPAAIFFLNRCQHYQAHFWLLLLAPVSKTEKGLGRQLPAKR